MCILCTRTVRGVAARRAARRSLASSGAPLGASSLQVHPPGCRCPAPACSGGARSFVPSSSPRVAHPPGCRCGAPACGGVQKRSFFGFGGGADAAGASLEGKVAWVVGGVDVVGQGLVRGLLDAGANVIVNTRSQSRLEQLVEGLGHPEKLTALKGSLLPGAAEATVDHAMEITANRLDHVVAHAGVRSWAGRGACDETGLLTRERLFTLSDEDFALKAVQLSALHFSAARHLLPRLSDDSDASYTFFVGGTTDERRSALGGINVRACAGVAAALRHEAAECKVSEVKVDLTQPPQDEDAFLQQLGALAAGVAGRAAGDRTAVCDVSTPDLGALLKQYPAASGGLDAEPETKAA